MTTNNLRTLEELIKIDFQEMYLRWGAQQPLRTGLHASALLVSQSEWCTRQHVLMALYSDKAEQVELQQWQWKQQDTFLHGWEIHRKWQHLFRHFADVVYGNGVGESGIIFPNMPELDLTHYDETRNVYFSPDAILTIGGEKYVVEIKGVKQESYQDLTDSLTVAMRNCDTVNKAYYQAQLYMHLLELKRGIILVENKNTQEFKLWIIEYDQAI